MICRNGFVFGYDATAVSFAAEGWVALAVERLDLLLCCPAIG